MPQLGSTFVGTALLAETGAVYTSSRTRALRRLSLSVTRLCSQRLYRAPLLLCSVASHIDHTSLTDVSDLEGALPHLRGEALVLISFLTFAASCREFPKVVSTQMSFRELCLMTEIRSIATLIFFFIVCQLSREQGPVISQAAWFWSYGIWISEKEWVHCWQEAKLHRESGTGMCLMNSWTTGRLVC